jgi:hypothetical protein
VEDSDRVRASLHAPDPKLATRNPTRVLPDVAGERSYSILCINLPHSSHFNSLNHPRFCLQGFTSLSKNEIKRDTREIDKRSGLMVRKRMHLELDVFVILHDFTATMNLNIRPSRIHIVTTVCDRK